MFFTIQATVSFIVYALSLIPMVICTIILARCYLQTRYKHYLWIGGVGLFVLVTFFLACLATLLDNRVIGIVSFYAYLPVGFLWVAAFDTMSHDSVGPTKMIIMAVAAAFVIFTSLVGTPMRTTTAAWGEEIRVLNGAFAMAFFVYLLLSKSMLAYYFTKIYRHLPADMRGWEAKLFVGSGLFSVVAFPVAMLGALYQYIPAMTAVLFAILFILLIIPLIRIPKLAFVLPFQVMRLSVIHTEEGISLFTHTWKAGAGMADEDLFTGMVQGVTMILQESVQQGSVRVIELENGVLFIQRNSKFPVACVLVASRTSKTLRGALAMFAGKFFDQFGEFLDKPNQVSQFKPVESLVTECFPFVPEYDQ